MPSLSTNWREWPPQAKAALLAAAAVLDRADVKTAAKQAREIDQDELDREIERRLAQLASGSEAALADALASAGGDPG